MLVALLLVVPGVASAAGEVLPDPVDAGTESAGSVSAAVAEAAVLAEPVVVEPLVSESAAVFALPDGSFSLEVAAGPVRVADASAASGWVLILPRFR